MTAALTRAAPILPGTPQTVADFKRLIDSGRIGEDARLELIEGELVGMPAKDNAHELLKSHLALTLARAIDRRFFVGVATTLQLADNVLVEPDILLCRSQWVRASAEDFITIDGAAILLIAEVASSSLAYDRGRKAGLYARHGITELWVVDAATRHTFVHRGPHAGGWSSLVDVVPEQALRLAGLPDFTITLGRLD